MSLDLNTRKPMSWDSLIKIVFYLVVASAGYAGYSTKQDEQQKAINKIIYNQEKISDRWDAKTDEIKLEIAACQTQIAVLKEQIEDIKKQRR